jgi:hypothetical protein
LAPELKTVPMSFPAQASQRAEAGEARVVDVVGNKAGWQEGQRIDRGARGGHGRGECGAGERRK